MITFLSSIIFLVLSVFVPATAEPEAPIITNFADCVAAGNPVMESYPAQCVANGQVFVEKIEEPIDGCGDGVCAEYTCQAIGCPLPETAESCPQDCAK